VGAGKRRDGGPNVKGRKDREEGFATKPNRKRKKKGLKPGKNKLLETKNESHRRKKRIKEAGFT